MSHQTVASDGSPGKRPLYRFTFKGAMVIIPSIYLPCHLLYIYNGAVLIVAPKHLLLYTLPIGSEWNGPPEVICSSPPELSFSAFLEGTERLARSEEDLLVLGSSQKK